MADPPPSPPNPPTTAEASPRRPLPETIACPFCEGEITKTARKCRFCSEWVARDCLSCGTPLRGDWAARGMCAECGKKSKLVPQGAPMAVKKRKNRVTAAIFALMLGGMGAHKFYLDRPGMGVVYFFLCWTLIPFLLSFVEGVSYLMSTDEEFWQKHG